MKIQGFIQAGNIIKLYLYGFYKFLKVWLSIFRKECEEQISGFPCNKYKGFNEKIEAYKFLIESDNQSINWKFL